MTQASSSPLNLQQQLKTPQQGFSGVFGKEALQGLLVDTLGILGPKLVVARGQLNRTEEWVLEGLEDIAFYFAVPLAGQFLFNRLFQNIVQKKGLTITGQTLAKPLLQGSNPILLGAKAGILLSCLAVAGGIEYLVPHIKNIITATAYKTKNFTAVANLENSRLSLKADEIDPVEKGKSRIIPVLGAVAGTIGLGLLLPSLASRSKALQNVLKGFTQHVDFGQSSAFDMSKPILAILAMIGLGSYLDGARDTLERKELFTRVAVFTIPYYLFGKELVGNALGWFFQNQSVNLHGKPTLIKSLVPFLDPKLPKTSFLDFNKVISSDRLKSSLNSLNLPNTLKNSILGKHKFLSYAKFGISALIVGVLSNLLAYHNTKQAYQSQQKEFGFSAKTATGVHPNWESRPVQKPYLNPVNTMSSPYFRTANLGYAHPLYHSATRFPNG